MKKLLIFALLLTSCRTAQWHYQKAIDKGMTFEPTIDTVYTYRLDTIRDVLTNEILRVDTIRQTTIRTVEKAVFVNMTRQERLAIQDSMKHIQKMYKLETVRKDKEIKHLKKIINDIEKTKQVQAKQTGKTERIDGIVWIVALIVAGIALIGVMLWFLPRMWREPR